MQETPVRLNPDGFTDFYELKKDERGSLDPFPL